MTARRPLIVLLACCAALVALAVSWAVWPTSDARADLRERARTGAPSTTTAPDRDGGSRSTATTTTPPDPTAPPASSSPATTAPTTAAIVPTRLVIASLGVDAPVVPVGLAPDGQMEIPAATEVGWYDLGPRPGEPGSAVLAAHVDYAGRRGAFFDLAGIPVGAEVLLHSGTGTQRYVVTERHQEAKATVRLERYFTRDGPARITLITCGGAFDRGVGHYQDNLFVTATPA